MFFRAVAAAPGYADALSFPYRPFTFIEDPPAQVAITIEGQEQTGGNTADTPVFRDRGSFKFGAKIKNTTNGRFIERLSLLMDGKTVNDFDGGVSTADVDYRIAAPGHHILEAIATDDLGISGAAPPVHIFIPPPNPGRVFFLNKSGDWNDPSNWDVPGNPGVPGVDDFAIIGTNSVRLTSNVTIAAASLNGGTLSFASTGTPSGPKTLTVNYFFTIAAGTITTNIIIPNGSTCEFLNDVDVPFSGDLTYAGSVRFHGRGGIAKVTRSAASAAGAIAPDSDNPDNFLDGVGGFFHAVGNTVVQAGTAVVNTVKSGAQFVTDRIAGGLGGSSKRPPPATHAPKPRKIDIAAHSIVGVVAAVPAPLASIPRLLSNNSGTLVASGGGNLVASGGGNLVASGGGNLIATNAKLISQDGGGLISQDGGGLVASGGGNVKIGGNTGSAASRTHAATAPAAFVIEGGETNIDNLTIEGPVLLNGGTLSGSGLVLGDVTNNGGFITPGHSAGAIAVLGNFSQGANGTMVLENGGPDPTQFDQLRVTGSAALGGKLVVNTIDGYTPDAADMFNPLEYSSMTGAFSSISGNAQVSFGATGAVATVNPAVPNAPGSKLLNIATRLRVEQGDNALIGGFYITGSASKKVLIRALAPSLSRKGVAGTLDDPTLELDRDDTVNRKFNDDWQQGDRSQIPSFLEPEDARESVIVATLAPGPHTAIVSGKGSSTGVAIVEVYDLEGAAPEALANISTRGLVQTGDNVMIGGLIIGGTTPTKVLIRAIGPSLGTQGVAGTLADPALELVDSNGNTTNGNQDWRNDDESAIAATGVPPTSDREAAILATLVPGNYTAIVRGKDGSTGVALVEAYNLQ